MHTYFTYVYVIIYRVFGSDEKLKTFNVGLKNISKLSEHVLNDVFILRREPRLNLYGPRVVRTHATT